MASASSTPLARLSSVHHSSDTLREFKSTSVFSCTGAQAMA